MNKVSDDVAKIALLASSLKGRVISTGFPILLNGGRGGSDPNVGEFVPRREGIFGFDGDDAEAVHWRR